MTFELIKDMVKLTLISADRLMSLPLALSGAFLPLAIGIAVEMRHA
jgi:hypothetical protein